MGTTIYQCLIEAKKQKRKHPVKWTNPDKKIIGEAVISAWNLVSSDVAPEKIIQQETTKKGMTREYNVNKYPIEFKPVIMNIINEHLKKKDGK